MAQIAELILRAKSDEVRRAKGDLNDLRTSGSKAESGITKATDKMSKGFNVAAASASKVAVAATAVVAAVAGLSQTISVIREFESSMSQVSAITGATRGELEALRDVAKELGSTTEFSASQAADGIKFLGMAGFDAAESIAAIPAVLDLATASAMGLASAADISSNIISGFGLAAGEAAKVADVLAYASSNANTNVMQLGSAMSTVAPISASLGIDLQDTAAAIGAMSDAGIQGERAGTALRGVLASLAGPTKQAKEALESYGITAAQVNPETTELAEIFSLLGERGLSTADAMTIFGREAASGALVLVEAADSMNTFSEELRGAEGAASDMAGVMRDNLAGSANSAVSALQGLAISIGEAGLTRILRTGLDFVTKMARGLTGLIDSVNSFFNSLSTSQQQQKIFEQATDNVTIALGDQIRQLGQLQQAMANSATVSISVAESRLAEAEAIREVIAAEKEQLVQRALVEAGYGEILARMASVRSAMSGITAGLQEADGAAAMQAESFREMEQTMIALLSQQQAMLSAARENVTLSDEQEAALAEAEAAAATLRNQIDNMKNGLVLVNGKWVEVVTLTDRATTSTSNATSAAGNLVAQLSMAAAYAAQLSANLGNAPAAIKGLQDQAEVLTAQIAAIKSGQDAISAGAAGYRKQLEQQYGLSTAANAAEEAYISAIINKQVAAYESVQRLNKQYSDQVSQLNKIAKASGKSVKQTERELKAIKASISPYTKYNAEMEKLAKFKGLLSDDEMAKAISDLNVELANSLPIVGELTDSLVDGLFNGFEDGLDGMLKSFEGWLKQMIATALKNQIVIGLGFSGGSTAGGVAQTAGGILGGGGGSHLGLLNGVGLLGGGGFASGVGSGLFGVLSGGGLGSSFANLSGLIGGSSGFSAGALGAALPAAGIVLGGLALLSKGLSRKYAGSGIRGEFGSEGFEGSQIDFYKGGFLRSNRTVYKDLEDELEVALDQTFVGMVDGLKEMSSVLGLSTDALSEFNKEGFTLWTNGKSQEEIMSALEEEMTKAAEGMADLILTTDKFSKTGETTLETIQRLGGSLITVNDAFDLLGRRQFNESMLGGHRASDLVSSFGGAEQFNAVVTSYFSTFYSESEKLEVATRRMTEQFTELGFEMPKTREGFRDLVEAQKLTTKEGRDAYAALLGLSSGFDQLVTMSENAVVAVDEVSEGLSDAARQQRISLRRQLYGLLDNEEKLRQMELRALDPANHALQERIWRLEELKEAEKEAAAEMAQRRNLREQLWKLLGKTDKLRARELNQIAENNRGLQERIWRLEDEAAMVTSLQNSVSSAMDAVSNAISNKIELIENNAQNQIDTLSSDLSDAASRADAARSAVIGFINDIENDSVGSFRRMRDEIRGVINARGAISEAQELSNYRSAQAQIIDFATGKEFTSDQLSSALKGVQTNNSRFFSSFSEYAFDTAKTTQSLRDLESVTNEQLSEAEQQVAALRELYGVNEEGFNSLSHAVSVMNSETAKAEQIENQIMTLEAWRENQITLLEQQLEQAKEQADAALGIGDALLSVADALVLLQTSIGSLGSFTGSMTRDQLRTFAISNQTGNASALWDYEQRILSSDRTTLKPWEMNVYDDLKIKGFSGGGDTGWAPRSGGLDGEGGFLAMLHPRETVVDHHNGENFMNMKEVIAELQAVRKELYELKAHTRQVNINTGRTARTQVDWDRNGIPAERAS